MTPMFWRNGLIHPEKKRERRGGEQRKAIGLHAGPCSILGKKNWAAEVLSSFPCPDRLRHFFLWWRDLKKTTQNLPKHHKAHANQLMSGNFCSLCAANSLLCGIHQTTTTNERGNASKFFLDFYPIWNMARMSHRMKPSHVDQVNSSKQQQSYSSFSRCPGQMLMTHYFKNWWGVSQQAKF